MKLLTRSLWIKIIEYRTAILFAIFFTVASLGTAILASLTGSVWSQMDTQNKVMIVIAIAVNWSNSMMAYLSKRAKKDEPQEDVTTRSIALTETISPSPLEPAKINSTSRQSNEESVIPAPAGPLSEGVGTPSK